MDLSFKEVLFRNNLFSNQNNLLCAFFSVIFLSFFPFQSKDTALDLYVRDLAFYSILYINF